VSKLPQVSKLKRKGYEALLKPIPPFKA